MINLGNNASQLFLGNSPVQKAYLGGVEVYSGAPPETGAGINWQGIIPEGIPNRNRVGIEFLNDRFLAFTDTTTGDRILSFDGENWVENSFPSIVDSIAFGNGVFVITRATGSADAEYRTSTDAITWTLVSGIPFHEVGRVVFGNGVFVSFLGRSFRTSIDGVNWREPSPLPGEEYPSGMIFGGGIFSTTSAHSASSRRHPLISLDGENWTRAENPAPRTSTVAYGNEVFVSAYRANRTIGISEDGLIWDSITLPSTFPNGFSDITFGDGRFVLIASRVDPEGYGQVYTSPDGINWTKRPSPHNSWQSVAYGLGKFIAVGTGSIGPRIMISE